MPNGWDLLCHAIPQGATHPAPLIFPLLPALARWTVPDFDSFILKDGAVIDYCEGVQFGTSLS